MSRHNQSSPVVSRRGRETAAGGGGGKPHPSRSAFAPSTMLRMVPLPRFAGEDG